MKLLYRVFFWILPGILKVLSLFSGKIRHFLTGRRTLFQDLENFRRDHPGKLVWIHVASLGEYEQARPILARWKAEFPEYFVLVSFFSPSGYDHVIKKPQPHVDFITYLPLDQKSNAIQFVQIIQPTFALFVKYDLWFEHINALKKAGIPIFLVAAAFRENQIYFKVYGSFFKSILHKLDWIFTQNSETVQLLNASGIYQTTQTGDTRFDRVAATAAAPKDLPEIKKWIDGRPTIVVGSAWEEDMALLIPLINSHPAYCWIIAPHDLDVKPMDRWASQIQQESVRYSLWDSNFAGSVLFIDNIGMLSSLYQFAKVGYVGGAFGKGLHNILEALGFGIPVIFGKVKKPGKFPEAAQSVAEGCGFSISDFPELETTFLQLEQPDFYQQSAKSAQNWVKSNLGAADKIVEAIRTKIQNP